MASSFDIYPILKKLSDEIVEVAQKNLGATRTVKGANGKSYKRRAVDTGTLRRSLNATIRNSANSYVINFGAKGNAAKYFRAVNDGRRKGSFPPLDPILRWAGRKKLRLRNEKGGFVKTDAKAMKQIAYKVAAKIKREGIAPFPFYTDAITEVLARQTPEVLNQIQKELELKLKEWQ